MELSLKIRILLWYVEQTILIALLVVPLGFSSYYLYLDSKIPYKVNINKIPKGLLVSAVVNPNTLFHSTTISTDSHTFVVEGTVNAMKGSKVTYVATTRVKLPTVQKKKQLCITGSGCYNLY